MTAMLDEKTKMAIALKRFSLISPIVNGQVKSIGSYCAEATAQPIDMPHYGLKSYSPNTVNSWYSDYVRFGLDGLKPQPRSDRGKTRALTEGMAERVLAKAAEYPKTPTTVIYDMLVEERAFLKSEVSLAIVRFCSASVVSMIFAANAFLSLSTNATTLRISSATISFKTSSRI
jgi:hypothetical protein